MTTNIQDRRCLYCESFSEKAPIFKLLSRLELAIINKDGYSVKYKAGEMIIKQGTSATHIVSLVDGMAKILLEGNFNRNLILKILKPWQILGSPGIHSDNRHPYSVIAVENSIVCFIDRENFNKVLHRNAKFAYAFIEYLSYSSVNNLNKMLNLTQKNMQGRLADALMYLSNFVYGDTSFSSQLSRQDLADLSVMSKENVSRILKEFENDNVIRCNQNNLEIISSDKLNEISLKGKLNQPDASLA
jgi:CRP/FNR family transcriptional regulator